MNEPRPELFDDVAGQFERLEQPLGAEWVRDRKVTLGEIQAVSDRLALVIRGYLALSPRDRIAFVTQGIFTREGGGTSPGERPKKSCPVGQKDA